MWEEAGVPRENSRIKAGDRRPLSHTTAVNHGDRTRVTASSTPVIGQINLIT